MLSATKKLGLGLIAGLLLSTVPAQEAQAFSPVDEFKSLSVSSKIAVVTAIVMVPYLVNFFGRKPLTAPRFDSNKLLHGSLTEKAQHAHYFFLDKVLGWPHKDNKIVVADKDGKPALDVKMGHEAAGALGLSFDYLENSAKAIDLPKKILTSVVAIIVGLKICSGEFDMSAMITTKMAK